MKTPDQIKIGLALCTSDEAAADRPCPYGGNCEECDDKQTLKADALAYIEELEARISLMMIQMQGDCGVCKRREIKDEVCAKCLSNPKRPMWEYEGLPEAKSEKYPS